MDEDDGYAGRGRGLSVGGRDEQAGGGLRRLLHGSHAAGRMPEVLCG
jgi:hypothetical protein